jgi:hypothetical protein
MRWRTRILVLVLAVGSCGDDNPEMQTGTWGGLGIQMDVSTSGAAVMFCCGSTGQVSEPINPDSTGEFFVRGTLSTLAGDYRGTVSGNTARVTVTAYPPTDPSGAVLIAPNGNPYFDLTYGVGFIEKDTSTNPPRGCVCLCVGCP